MTDRGVFETSDAIFLHDGRLLNTHAAGQCSGTHCTIHNPSDHPLNKAPLNWREDRQLMERICTHGVGHPDRDGLAHLRKALGDKYATYAFDRHGCDGCC